jgi:hypothetical protein
VTDPALHVQDAVQFSRQQSQAAQMPTLMMQSGLLGEPSLLERLSAVPPWRMAVQNDGVPAQTLAEQTLEQMVKAQAESATAVAEQQDLEGWERDKQASHLAAAREVARLPGNEPAVDQFNLGHLSFSQKLQRAAAMRGPVLRSEVRHFGEPFQL